MAERKKWTKEEDDILVQAIKANPHNKAEAFRIASKKMERDVTSCSNRWYRHLSNPESKSYAGCMFTLIGHSSRLDNRTIATNNVQPIKTNKSLWGKIKKLLGL